MSEPQADVTPASRWLGWLHNLEDALLALILLSMVLLASSQVIMRNLFDSGFTWGDPLLRLLVLWLGLMGAMVGLKHSENVSEEDRTVDMEIMTEMFIKYVTLRGERYPSEEQ